jgi:hypothetical protein
MEKAGIVKLTNLNNTSFRLKYTPQVWKIAEVIMIPKPRTPLNEVNSHRPISLLPVVSKLFENFLLKRVKIIIERKYVIPMHQFGFREKHFIIEEEHRLTDVIENTLEETMHNNFI